jgi:hypothetical protein
MCIIATMLGLSVCKLWNFQVDPKPLLYKHIPKTGGKHLENILTAVVGKNTSFNLAPWGDVMPAGGETAQFSYIPESHPLTIEVRAAYYVVSSIRHPCDYYLSLWAFGSEGRGTFRNKLRHQIKDAGLKEVYGQSPPFNRKEDLNRFTLWLQVNPYFVFLALISRFFCSYCVCFCPFLFFLQHARGELSKRVLSSFAKNMQIGRFTDNVDCWVHTEDMDMDLRACFKSFVAQGGKVDMSEYKIQLARMVHPSTHERCSSYFNAVRENMVRTHDRLVFNHFNYTECCSG